MRKGIISALCVFVCLCVILSAGAAADTGKTDRAPFAYEHDPRDNPGAMRDIVYNPDAVYGFSPSKAEESTLKDYADAIDWTDEKQVADARGQRLAYHDSMEELYDMILDLVKADKDIETIARTVSRRRNELPKRSRRSPAPSAGAAMSCAWRPVRTTPRGWRSPKNGTWRPTAMSLAPHRNGCMKNTAPGKRCCSRPWGPTQVWTPAWASTTSITISMIWRTGPPPERPFRNSPPPTAVMRPGRPDTLAFSYNFTRSSCMSPKNFYTGTCGFSCIFIPVCSIICG